MAWSARPHGKSKLLAQNGRTRKTRKCEIFKHSTSVIIWLDASMAEQEKGKKRWSKKKQQNCRTRPHHVRKQKIPVPSSCERRGAQGVITWFDNFCRPPAPTAFPAGLQARDLHHQPGGPISLFDEEQAGVDTARKAEGRRSRLPDRRQAQPAPSCSTLTA